MHKLMPVILAGGAGTRLWPVSRALLPKQFIQFPQQTGSLFQNTLSRLGGIAGILDPVVVCNEEHRFLVAEQLRQLDVADAQIILEPFGRNTAPATAVAALQIIAARGDVLMLVLPADHLIQDVAALQAAIMAAVPLAAAGRLVTFGIVPQSAETGYGYIRKGAALPAPAFAVDRFVEKPDLATARSYLDSGEYLWNSGMFLFAASVWLRELKQRAPHIHDCCVNVQAELRQEGEFLRIDPGLFETCPADSIDYAVMEKTSAAAVLPLDAGWNDLGAWSALQQIGSKDGDGNVVSGDVLLTDVSGSYVQSSSRLVTAVGIRDIVVVETSDAVLVADRHKVQNVKQIVDLLKQMQRSEHHSHDLVKRPWGSYESLVNTDGYQVKHIVVNPGASLSLQLHHHRAEHWIVIRGEATVTRDDEVFTLVANESTHIPLGSKHRLQNRGDSPCEIIEVQVGDYLGEDDIVRFEDVYGRVPAQPIK